MSQAYIAAIFDFEGTLVDFQWQLAPAEEELRRSSPEGGRRVPAALRRLWNAAADLLAPQGRMAELRQAWSHLRSLI
jgi:FMN phosphatase YigB (HAD superfamily)